MAGASFVSLQASAGTDPQCATYLFSSLTGPEFLETLHENGAITGHTLNLGDEVLSDPIDLVGNGVSFNYFNRPVRWLVIASNGFVYLRGDDQTSAELRAPGALSSGRGAGERLPERGFGALIAPYWEDYDPSGVHCGNAAGRVHWKVVGAGASSSMVIEFDSVKACGGGSSATKNIASWQLVLNGADGSFDIVLSYARGDSGLHTIGFQDWSGREGQMICHGEGETKCFKEETTYRVATARPSYSCHADGVCSTAALAAQGGGAAGGSNSGPKYAACECPDCFMGDGLSSCTAAPCTRTASDDGLGESSVPSPGTATMFELVAAVLISLIVGVSVNTLCHRWARCPMYRSKIHTTTVSVGGPPQVVLGSIVEDQPPLPTGAFAAPPDGMWLPSGADGGFNPLVTMTRVVPPVDDGGGKAKQQEAKAQGSWLAGGASGGGGGGGGGGGPAYSPREP